MKGKGDGNIGWRDARERKERGRRYWKEGLHGWEMKVKARKRVLGKDDKKECVCWK